MVLDWSLWASPDVLHARGFWIHAACWAFIFVVLWSVMNLILRFLCSGTEIGGVKCGTWALKCGMIFHHAVVGCSALFALWEDPAIRRMYHCLGCTEAAVDLLRGTSGPSLAAQTLMPITMGYMIGDLILLSQWHLPTGKGMLENVLMILHHILSLASWPVTLYYDFCNRYVLILLSYELTSVFLILNWMLSTSGRKKSFAYLASGIIFTGSFVLMRMVGAFPQLMAIANAPPFLSTAKLADLPTWTRLCGGSFLILPHVLNFFWGVKVLKGFAAAVCPRPAETQGKKD